jgi:arsenate reductase-like glutaredoxin family protein
LRAVEAIGAVVMEAIVNLMCFQPLGWQALLNTRGTTWRKLDESLRNSIDNADAAAALT